MRRLKINVIFTLVSRPHCGRTDLPEVALFFRLIYHADKPTVKEEQLSERDSEVDSQSPYRRSIHLSLDVPHCADNQVACLRGQRLLGDAALTPRFKHPHYSVFLRPGSRNSQNTVGSRSQKGDETRGNSSVVNANSQRSGSTRGCFSCSPFQ